MLYPNLYKISNIGYKVVKCAMVVCYQNKNEMNLLEQLHCYHIYLPIVDAF
jgi:hypothetical protein